MPTQQYVVSFDGFSQVKSEVRAWEKRLQKTLKRVVTEYTLLIEGEAKRLAPVDTGRMRAAIHHELTQTATEVVGLVLSGTDYEIHVEFGTRYMAAQPHLRPAFEKFKDPFIRAVEDAVNSQT